MAERGEDQADRVRQPEVGDLSYGWYQRHQFQPDRKLGYETSSSSKCILRRAQALRGTLRSACSGSSAVGERPQRKQHGSPVHSTKAFCRRTVPHASFAAVQDDKPRVPVSEETSFKCNVRSRPSPFSRASLIRAQDLLRLHSQQPAAHSVHRNHESDRASSLPTKDARLRRLHRHIQRSQPCLLHGALLTSIRREKGMKACGSAKDIANLKSTICILNSLSILCCAVRRRFR